jgi:hypothetical protein
VCLMRSGQKHFKGRMQRNTRNENSWRTNASSSSHLARRKTEKWHTHKPVKGVRGERVQVESVQEEEIMLMIYYCISVAYL